MNLLGYTVALFAIVHTLCAQDILPPPVKAYREELADPDRLAEELLRVRRDAPQESALVEVALGIKQTPQQVTDAVDAALAALQKKAAAAAEKREQGTATKDESRMEAAHWRTISRLFEVTGKRAEAHAARLSRQSALTQFASPDEWLEGALEISLSFRTLPTREMSGEWMERCRALVATDPAFRTSERAKVRIAFHDAVAANEHTGLATAAAAVLKTFGAKDPFSMTAYETLVFGTTPTKSAPQIAQNWRQLLELREAAFGASHPATLRLALKFGRYLRTYGDKAEGTRMIQRTVDGWISAGVLDSESRLSTAETIAIEGRHRCDTAYTAKLLRTLIPISEKLRGPENRDTLWLRSDLAIVIGDIGNYAESEQMNRDLTAIRKRVYGPEDSDTITSINNTAVQIESQGRYREALAMYEEAYALRIKIDKEDDAETLRTKSNIAVQLVTLGRFDEAAPLVTSVLEMRTKALGARHRDTIYSKGQLAGLHFSKGDIVTAEKATREYLSDTEQALGSEHPNSRGARYYLATILIEKGETAAALGIARELSDWYEKHPAEDRTGKIDADMLAGEGISQSGADAEALPKLIEAVRAQEALSGPSHLATLRGKFLIARVQARTAKAQEADALLRSIISSVAENLDAQHPLIAEAAIELVDLLKKAGKFEEAAALATRARDIAVKKLHPDSPLRKRCEKL